MGTEREGVELLLFSSFSSQWGKQGQLAITTCLHSWPEIFPRCTVVPWTRRIPPCVQHKRPSERGRQITKEKRDSSQSTASRSQVGVVVRRRWRGRGVGWGRKSKESGIRSPRPLLTLPYSSSSPSSGSLSILIITWHCLVDVSKSFPHLFPHGWHILLARFLPARRTRMGRKFWSVMFFALVFPSHVQRLPAKVTNTPQTLTDFLLKKEHSTFSKTKNEIEDVKNYFEVECFCFYGTRAISCDPIRLFWFLRPCRRTISGQRGQSVYSVNQKPAVAIVIDRFHLYER